MILFTIIQFYIRQTVPNYYTFIRTGGVKEYDANDAQRRLRRIV